MCLTYIAPHDVVLIMRALVSCYLRKGSHPTGSDFGVSVFQAKSTLVLGRDIICLFCSGEVRCLNMFPEDPYTLPMELELGSPENHPYFGFGDLIP